MGKAKRRRLAGPDPKEVAKKLKAQAKAKAQALKQKSGKQPPIAGPASSAAAVEPPADEAPKAVAPAPVLKRPSAQQLEAAGPAGGVATPPKEEEPQPAPDDPAGPLPPLKRAGGGMYGTGDVILLVGEGDLSFACSLMERLGSSAYIVATVLDSTKALRRKYPSSAYENAKRLTSAGLMVKYGVDCKLLHKVREFEEAFTKIVFNFPHLGTDDAGVQQHQELLRDFLASAAQCLERIPSAEIHITLKSGEPYNSWKCQSMAKLVGGGTVLRCDRIVPFDALRYPGYQHRRTRGQVYEEGRGLSSDNVVEGAKTYVFKLRKEVLD